MCVVCNTNYARTHAHGDCRTRAHLDRRVDVEAAREHERLVRDNTHRAAVHASEPNNLPARTNNIVSRYHDYSVNELTTSGTNPNTQYMRSAETNRDATSVADIRSNRGRTREAPRNRVHVVNVVTQRQSNRSN
jgi:hypothetical protein